jgi:hypothetical protein
MGSMMTSAGTYLPALSNLFKPSVAPGNPALASQLSTLGITGPSSLAPGQDTSGMFGPAPITKAGLPLMMGGMGLSNLGGGRVTKDLGTAMQTIGPLLMLASL